MGRCALAKFGSRLLSPPAALPPSLCVWPFNPAILIVKMSCLCLSVYLSVTPTQDLVLPPYPVCKEEPVIWLPKTYSPPNASQQTSDLAVLTGQTQIHT